MTRTLPCISAFILLGILSIGLTSAISAVSCGGEDLCTWDKVLPLGSFDNAGCGLSYNTLWQINTETTVQCSFDGTGLENSQFHISIDNDVLSCTLNGNSIVTNYVHENCAPVDPRNGYTVDITPQTGENTIVCRLKDRGVMSHFDACVTGERNDDVPEFSSIAAGIALAGSTLGFIFIRRKK